MMRILGMIILPNVLLQGDNTTLYTFFCLHVPFVVCLSTSLFASVRALSHRLQI